MNTMCEHLDELVGDIANWLSSQSGEGVHTVTMDTIIAEFASDEVSPFLVRLAVREMENVVAMIKGR